LRDVDRDVEIRLHGRGDPPERVVARHALYDERLHWLRQNLHAFFSVCVRSALGVLRIFPAIDARGLARGWSLPSGNAASR
jgi:hypothetical protein